VITTADVVDARVLNDPEEPRVSILITLGPDGAQRFASATRDWRNRRIAIVLDGRVVSSPFVKEAITGGKAVIAMGIGPREKQLAEAQRLAASLIPD
jgi:preprotein translocase subunit SecD